MVSASAKELLIICFTLLLCDISLGQTNLDFEQGFKGWKFSNSSDRIALDSDNAYNGKLCIKIGSEGGAVFERIAVAQLSIVEYECYLKSEKRAVKGHSFVRFFDVNNNLLLEYNSAFVDSTKYQQVGNYTETPALTAFMEIGAEKDPSEPGYVYVDDFNIKMNIGVSISHHNPAIDLDRYMKPLWSSDTIYNETVLLYSTDGRPARGTLLYKPDKVLSISSFDLRRSYRPGRDFIVKGSVISRREGSPIPFRADTSFDTKNNLAWYDLQSQWVVVTYTHHDTWKGTVPVFKADRLPSTFKKLKTGRPLNIVAFGMSITRGLNVSSYDSVPPYMPGYIELFARGLRKAYQNTRIKLFNAGLPGATVDWGARYVEEYVAPLKPDLVIIDFGMNDFWRLTPEQFKNYVDTIILKLRVLKPTIEFILLSNMKFDPDYVLDSDKNKTWYEANLERYSKVLFQMESTGIVNLDMYSISDAIYKLKKAKDCIANPLHPNDYLARWYAQGLVALFTK